MKKHKQIEKNTPLESSRNLEKAMQRMRLSQAERNNALFDLKELEVARLTILADELKPLFKQIPKDSRFACAIVETTKPRLWIDILSYVVMASDRRRYKLIRERIDTIETIHTTVDYHEMADVVENYIAARLVEKERAHTEEDYFSQVLTTASKPGYISLMISFGAGIVSICIGLALASYIQTQDWQFWRAFFE